MSVLYVYNVKMMEVMMARVLGVDKTDSQSNLVVGGEHIPTHHHSQSWMTECARVRKKRNNRRNEMSELRRSLDSNLLGGCPHV